MRRTAACLAVGLFTLLMAFMICRPGSAASAGGRPPVLAYYYIWYNQQFWNHGKNDYPAMGRYSSDDAGIMRQQIELARAAGIDGFIVSWKNTSVLNARLAKLTAVAQAEHFKLAIIYEGLDFHRRPLPVGEVEAGLSKFAAQYNGNPVFNIFGNPLVIWSGTWEFSSSEIQGAVAPVKDKLLVLASEKNVNGIQRLSGLVDGDAYYWSSVNPDTYPDYSGKLRAMAAAVHAQHGLWIAPFAPGFDARLVGGTTVVPRNNGDTLRREYNTAVTSSPDALGLISWNEYSENSEVEPSRKHGNLYLHLVRELTRQPFPAGIPAGSGPGIDSSEPAGAGGSGIAILSLLLVAAVLVLAAVLVRRRRATNEEPPSEPKEARARVREGPGGRWRQWPKLSLVMFAALLMAGSFPTADPLGSAPLRPSRPTLPNNYLGHKLPSDKVVVVGAAGDIACASDRAGLTEELGKPDSCRQQSTAALMARVIHPQAVLALGDNQYPSGDFRRYNLAYAHSWGRFKAITYPIPGNHEYGTPGARGYFAYFGKAAGKPGEGYYSYNLGSWHMVALNSECENVGGCGPGSRQERWLRQDLTAHPADCTLAYWHRPRWSSGTHRNNPDYRAFWRDLYAAGVDVVLNGHDHDYERFAALTPGGKTDPARGIREFVVGTGGDSHYLIHAPVNGSRRRIPGVYGVLELRLSPQSYSWRFISAPGEKTLDSGSAACH
jgi:hypothetical protein